MNVTSRAPLFRGKKKFTWTLPVCGFAFEYPQLLPVPVASATFQPNLHHGRFPSSHCILWTSQTPTDSETGRGSSHNGSIWNKKLRWSGLTVTHSGVQRGEQPPPLPVGLHMASVCHKTTMQQPCLDSIFFTRSFYSAVKTKLYTRITNS